MRHERTELGVLLDELVAFIRRYVVLSKEQASAVALWVVHTHALEAAEATPYLAITSAESRSGKTLLLEVLELLVARPWMTGRTSAAALVRKIDQETPTLLLDESDTAFKGPQEYSETLRGLLNTGYRRGGKSTACVRSGGSWEVVDFSTFSPKAIAGIGKLPDTVSDRSIPIALPRRSREEPIERFRRREITEQARPLKARVAASALRECAELAAIRPDLPDALTDRAQDVWEPLLAIADLADGTWPERARAAAVLLMTDPDVEDASLGVQLLAAVREVFATTKKDRIASAFLVEALKALDESPWAELSSGRGLTPRTLATLLRPYGVRSRTVRLSSYETARGYLREQFDEAWHRYLPAELAASRVQSDTETQGASLRQELRVTSAQADPVVSRADGVSKALSESDVSDVSPPASVRSDRDVKGADGPRLGPGL